MGLGPEEGMPACADAEAHEEAPRTDEDPGGGTEAANACEVTWIAAVRLGGRLLHLAVDTGASSTILSMEAFARLFPEVSLQSCSTVYKTADGNLMPAIGTFTTTVNVGGMEVSDFLVTVSTVGTADGLLGMDFLHAADAWIGARSGILHMTWVQSVLKYGLMADYPDDEYTINAIERTVIRPHSHHMLRCKVDYRDGQIEEGRAMRRTRTTDTGDSGGPARIHVRPRDKLWGRTVSNRQWLVSRHPMRPKRN